MTLFLSGDRRTEEVTGCQCKKYEKLMVQICLFIKLYELVVLLASGLMHLLTDYYFAYQS